MEPGVIQFDYIPQTIKRKETKYTRTKIPRTLVQTFKTNYVGTEIIKNTKRMLNKNKTFNYMFVDDSLGIKTIKENFEPHVLEAFLKLKAGAAKGDFIRYCVLYVYGGIYVDFDSEIITNLESYLNYDFVFMYDGAPNLVQWFFMTTPKHPLFEVIIKEMVHRIHSGEQNIFLATGPTLVSDVVYNIINGTAIVNSSLLVPKDQRIHSYTTKWKSADLLKGGLITPEEPPEENPESLKRMALFTFRGYKKEYLYTTSNPRYNPTFNCPTPGLYY